MLRQTHTYVTLGVSKAAFDEIKKKLEDADYLHAFNAYHDEIDMTGIALVVEDANG